MSKARVGISLLALQILIALGALAQEIDLPPDTLPLSPAVRRGILENGLTYYIFRHNYPQGRIELSLVEDAGAYHNEPGELGVAHLIEHLGFRRTKSFPNGLADFFVKRGLIWGRDLNASTASTTNYNLTIPSNDTLLFRYGLHALHDWAKGRKYEREDVQEERAAVLREAQIADVPSFKSLKEAIYLLLDKNNLYRPSVTDEVKSIQHLSVKSLLEFDRRWYCPDQQAVFVVGDIDLNKTEECIRAVLSKIPARNDTSLQKKNIFDQYDVPLCGTNKVVITQNAHSNIRITILQKRKATFRLYGPATVHELRLNLIDEFYDELVKQRFDNLVFKDPEKFGDISHRVERRAIMSLAGIDALTTYINVNNVRDVKGKIQTAMKELHRIQRWAFTAEEFMAAKETVAKHHIDKLSSQTSQDVINKLMVYHLGGGVFTDDPKELDKRLINSITLNDVITTTRRWIGEHQNTDILFSIPLGSDHSDIQDKEVFNWIRRAMETQVKPLESIAMKVLPGPPPKADTSFTRSEMNTISATKLTLPNGITVVIKRLGPEIENPSSEESDIFLRAVTRCHGTNNTEEQQALNSIAATLTTSGIGTISQSELKGFVASKNTSGSLFVVPYVNGDEAGVTGHASAENLEHLLNLTYLYFSEPLKNKRTVRRLHRNHSNTRKAKTVFQLFDDSIRNSVINKSTRGRTTHVTWNRAFRTYNTIFTNPQNFTFIITGYFETDTMIKNVSKYLSALPKGRMHLNESSNPMNLDAAKPARSDMDLRVTMTGDSTGNVLVRILLPSSTSSSEATRLRLEVLANIIQIRLTDRLRRREKLVYYALANVRTDSDFFDVTFETAPADADNAIAAAIDEIANTLKNGVDEEALSSSVELVRMNAIKQMTSASYWVNHLAREATESKPFSNISERLGEIDSIRKLGVHQSFDDLLHTDHYLVFKLL
jgi:zinc protease